MKKAPKPGVVRFVSAGGISRSNFSGNQFKLLNVTGSPWDAGQDGAYGFENYRIRLDNYFGDSIFTAYDYFRVVQCETFVRWRSAPVVGPIMGDLYHFIDKDADQLPDVANIANRRELNHNTFSNEKQVRKIVWHPYVVTREGSGGPTVDYVQPRERWLNSLDVGEMRFGSLSLLATTPNKVTQYNSNDPAISIRHVVTIEVKGQKTLQLPSGSRGVAEKPQNDHVNEKTTPTIRRTSTASRKSVF